MSTRLGKRYIATQSKNMGDEINLKEMLQVLIEDRRKREEEIANERERREPDFQVERERLETEQLEKEKYRKESMQCKLICRPS